MIIYFAQRKLQTESNESGEASSNIGTEYARSNTFSARILRYFFNLNRRMKFLNIACFHFSVNDWIFSEFFLKV